MRKILVLEDDSSTAEILAEYLTQCGLQVVLAKNYDHAFEIARREKPDLCYIDGFMGGDACFKFLSSFRNTLPSAFIILTSACTAVAKEAPNYPVNAWLPKPFSLAEIDKILDQTA